MTRADLQPVSKESETRIELVRARFEVKIRRAFLNWRTEAEKEKRRPLTLTVHQQLELQALLVAQAVKSGEVEGVERLSATTKPCQFEIEIHCLLEIIPDEACNRWKILTAEFHLEASPEGVYADAERGVSCRVKESLISICGRLVFEAWSIYENRLQAECECIPLPVPPRAAPEAGTDPRTAVSNETLAQKVQRLRIDKGMALEQIAIEAGVDKKTVLRIVNKGSRPNPSTLKKLADALGVAASDLAR